MPASGPSEPQELPASVEQGRAANADEGRHAPPRRRQPTEDEAGLLAQIESLQRLVASPAP